MSFNTKPQNIAMYLTFLHIHYHSQWSLPLITLLLATSSLRTSQLFLLGRTLRMDRSLTPLCVGVRYHMLLHTYSLDHLTVLCTAVQGWNACGWPICPWTPYSPTEVTCLVMTVWEGTCIHCPRHWLLGILVLAFTACLDCILCPRSGCAFPVFICVVWVVERSLTQQKWHTSICKYTNTPTHVNWHIRSLSSSKWILNILNRLG